MAHLSWRKMVHPSVCLQEGKSPRILWKRYAACGSPELLERVRMGQKHPELWRVVLENACTILSSSLKKAG